MDFITFGQNETPKKTHSIPSVSSPEIFDSDSENETEEQFSLIENDNTIVANGSWEPTQAEMIARSDHCLLGKINKYLSGVPPPPRHTICQADCHELLLKIQQNRHLFWNSIDPEKETSQQQLIDKSPVPKQNHIITNLECIENPSNHSSIVVSDKCDFTSSVISTNNSDASDVLFDEIQLNQNISKNIASPFKTHRCTSNLSNEHTLLSYKTLGEQEAAALQWPQALEHKCFGIHYNRNQFIEDYENLSIKLCERYVGAETQSTCNVWFAKRSFGSPRKRCLLLKSPGKRLNHLTRRRRTFSSANLQCLGLADKKQLILNIKKSNSRKGKSPRGKSPRNSAKKRVVRKLSLEGPSPYKSISIASKKMLFQSPDKTGPNELLTCTTTNPQKIKRVLFPTPKKKETHCSNDVNKSNIEVNRKRKNEDELQGPKPKWLKSLSFDCSHELKTEYHNNWQQERYSSSNIISRNKSFNEVKCELSDTHRKKLLWAVAEALRSKGIGMSHPHFKQFASSLVRTVRKFMPELENRNIPRKSGSTSDRMLKLAKHHVLFLLDSKSNNA